MLQYRHLLSSPVVALRLFLFSKPKSQVAITVSVVHCISKGFYLVRAYKVLQVNHQNSPTKTYIEIEVIKDFNAENFGMENHVGLQGFI